jgi:hypothetical protein
MNDDISLWNSPGAISLTGIVYGARKVDSILIKWLAAALERLCERLEGPLQPNPVMELVMMMRAVGAAGLFFSAAGRLLFAAFNKGRKAKAYITCGPEPLAPDPAQAFLSAIHRTFLLGLTRYSDWNSNASQRLFPYLV